VARGREVRERIDNLKDTRKITKAMQMIASSRINKAQQRIEEARPFVEKVEDFIYNLGFCREVMDDRLVAEREDKKAVLILGMTADRGLCGAYNSNIFKLMKRQIKKYREEGLEVAIDIIGTRGKNHFQHAGYELMKVYEHLSEWPRFMDATKISRDLISRYIVGDADKVIICYTKYINPVSQDPRAIQLLPIPIKEHVEEKIRIEEQSGQSPMVCRYLPDFYYEPSLEEIVYSIVPEYIFTRIYGALLESTASEIGARATSMGKASNNSDELIEDLTRKYHKLRQQEITTEIVEVVSGAETYV
jgi:F-type H+-transporting ATPase subunit gamma